MQTIMLFSCVSDLVLAQCLGMLCLGILYICLGIISVFTRWCFQFRCRFRNTYFLPGFYCACMWAYEPPFILATIQGSHFWLSKYCPSLHFRPAGSIVSVMLDISPLTTFCLRAAVPVAQPAPCSLCGSSIAASAGSLGLQLGTHRCCSALLANANTHNFKPANQNRRLVVLNNLPC